jgi:hypothetical protein
MKKGDDIEERLVDFAVAVLGLCQVLPDTAAGPLLRLTTARPAGPRAAMILFIN